MRYDTKIKRLADAVNDIRHAIGGIRIVFKDADETTEQCLARHGLDSDQPGLTIIIVKFADQESQQTPAAVSDISNIDSEIARLTSELEQEGYSRQEILEMPAEQDCPNEPKDNL